MGVVLFEAELGEASESGRLEFDNSLSRRGGGRDRVVPKSPVTGAYRAQVSSYQPAVALGALEKVLSSSRACPKEITVPGTVATCKP